jgi:dihydroorotase
MMILLKNVKVISPGSSHHLKEKDILIENGTVKKIAEAKSIDEKNTEVIKGESLHVSCGWFDLHVNFSEPGHEYKEDIASGSLAAAQGGFTGVLVMPSTDPPASQRSVIEFIAQRSRNSIVDVHVAGCLSSQRKGVDLSEMYDMYQAGAKVFTDDKLAVQDSGLMIRALQYSKNFGGRIFAFPEDMHITGKGFVHEGVAATSLGLKGSPSIAEEIMISRDISLAEYTGSPIHFSTLSTKGSVDLIRKAKASGMKVTADVSATHLLLNDESLREFDAVFKVKPPLRSEEDRLALIDGLVDGTIDCICSDHIPQDVENKIKEFELAAFGAGGIETAFAVARTATKDKLSLPELISKFTSHPRNCAGIKGTMIEENQSANMTIFEPDTKWRVEEKYLKSKSKNNPFINRELTGKPVCVIHNGQIHYSR